MTLSELFEQEYERLAAYLSRHSDPETGEDLASEAFAKLAARDAARTPEVLWRAALNVLTDWGRNRSTRPDFVPPSALDDEGGEAHGLSVEQSLFRADFDRAFRRLPRPCAEAFTLVELRGLSTIEAASYLGVTQPTVSRRAALARAILKEELT
jgi:RNA polymerase sigma factor (sigma-70 family)